MEWLAVRETVNFLAAVVPRTMSLPPLIVTLETTGSSSAAAAAVLIADRETPKRSAAVVLSMPPSAACTAGTARAERARAPVTAATVARIRMCSPREVGESE